MFDTNDICQHLPGTIVVFVYILDVVAERFLGKTRFGSKVGLLVEHPVAFIVKCVRGK